MGNNTTQEQPAGDFWTLDLRVQDNLPGRRRRPQIYRAWKHGNDDQVSSDNGASGHRLSMRGSVYQDEVVVLTDTRELTVKDWFCHAHNRSREGGVFRGHSCPL